MNASDFRQEHIQLDAQRHNGSISADEYKRASNELTHRWIMFRGAVSALPLALQSLGSAATACIRISNNLQVLEKYAEHSVLEDYLRDISNMLDFLNRIKDEFGNA
jgi:hypothetical protein